MNDLRHGELYRVVSGSFVGALVRFHFVNISGNLDCRFAELFEGHREGEIVVVYPRNLGFEE